MDTQYQYDAFISYRHLEPDQTAAAKLQAMLESYRPPRGIAEGRRIRRVFRDSSELPTSGSLDDALKKALASSRYLILILSEKTRESKWCMAEVDLFIKLHGGRTDHILPVLVSGEPADTLPDALRFAESRETLTDGTEKVTRTEKEPICADIRGETPRDMNRKMKVEFLRLAAPLLGCGFDDLYQRHRKRRRRRVAVLTALILAVVIGYAGMMLHNYLEIQQKNRELASANRQLTEQKTELQVRESALLSERAEQYAQNGNDLAALRTALDALPESVADGDRPLYEPAESVLWRVMNKGTNKWWQNKSLTFGAEMTAETSIWRYALSSDARGCYTLDWNGTVRKYHTFTNELAWETDLPMSWSGIDGNAFGLLLSEKHGCVFANSELQTERSAQVLQQVITALDCEDGHLLWQFTIDTAAKKSMLLSPEENYLVFMTDQACWIFDLREGVRDGLAHSEMRFAGGSRVTECRITFDGDGEEALAGAFATKSEGYALHLFVIDPADPAGGRILDTSLSGSDTIYSLEYSRALGRIFAVTALKREKAHTTDAFCFDAGSGETLWRMATPESDYGWYSTVRTLLDVPNGILLLSADANLYALDVSSGTVRAQSRLDNTDARVTGLYTPGDGIYLGVLSDGDCWAGAVTEQWGETHLFTYDYKLNFPGAVLKSEPSDLIERGGGVRDARWLDDRATLEPTMGRGFSAYLTEENRLRIEWHMTFDRLWRTETSIPMESSEYVIPLSNERSALARDGKVTFLIEKLYGRDDEESYGDDGQYAYRLITLDTVSGEFSETALTLPFTIYQYGYNGCQFIPVSDTGDLLIGLNGTALMYYDAAAGQLRELYGSADAHTNDPSESRRVLAASQTADGAALAAVCGGGALAVWHNGPDAHSVPLLDDMEPLAPEDEAGRMFLVGENGYVLLGDGARSRFMVFSTADDAWIPVEDEARGASDRPAAIAHTAPLFAVADADRMIRIYDIGQGACAKRLPFHVPEGRVTSIGFASDDRYLFIVTENRIHLYDVGAGSLICVTDTTVSQDPVSVDTDAGANRLYICSGDEYDYGSFNIILDLETRTEIAPVEDVLAFVPETGRMVTYEALDHVVKLKTLPSPQTMIDAGREALEWIEGSGAVPRTE